MQRSEVCRFPVNWRAVMSVVNCSVVAFAGLLRECCVMNLCNVEFLSASPVHSFW